MRLLILEPHATGHHATYLRWLLQAIHRRNWSAAVATTEGALSHPALTTSDLRNVEIILIPNVSGWTGPVSNHVQLLRREFRYWRMFKRIVKEARVNAPVDFIVLPYLDYCLYALAILGAPFQDTPWCGISMRLAVNNPKTAASLPLPWKWRMAKRILRTSNLKSLFVINPSVADLPTNWCTAEELSRLRYLPDPAEYETADSRGTSREIVGLTNEKVAILVFGTIDDRKGMDALLAALASQADLASYVVIVAGKQSDNLISKAMKSAYMRLLSENRLIVFDRFVSDAERTLLLTASDVVWVGYRNHIYMSGVLVLAGKAGLPVIGTNEGEIGQLIAKYALGAIARIDQHAEVVTALRTMLDAETREEMGRRAKIAFEHHTVVAFGDRIVSAFDTGSSTCVE